MAEVQPNVAPPLATGAGRRMRLRRAPRTERGLLRLSGTALQPDVV